MISEISCYNANPASLRELQQIEAMGVTPADVEVVGFYSCLEHVNTRLEDVRFCSSVGNFVTQAQKSEMVYRQKRPNLLEQATSLRFHRGG